GAAAGLCAMAVLLDFRVPDVRPEKSIAAHPPALTHIAEPAATPVADAAPRIPATRKVQIAARRLPAVEAEPEYELVSDPVLVKAQLVAALDRSLTERNANVAGERTPVTVMRVGQPRVAFDPSGTSASVTYRKRFVYSRPEGSGQSIVDEQLFFANIDGSWQLIDRVSGPQASPYR
ncbi:MAG: hypothetical protein ABIT36_05555, partial [Steroidobacteraceae bacterium]